MAAILHANRRFLNRNLPSLHNLSYRYFSTIPKVPNKRSNFVVNFCDQGSEIVVERFGRYQRTENAGLFLSIPGVERLYKVDMREMVLPIDPQMAITRDNVRIELCGFLYLQFVDSYKACYGAVRPLVASINQAQAIMRSCVGKMELDDIFHNRGRLNSEIREGIAEAAGTWGLSILRYEVTDIVPDPKMAQAMDLQAAAERERRQQVRKAEADKEQTVLLSEAQRTKDTNESEGERIRLINTAEGTAQKIKLEAEAQRELMISVANGEAKRIVLEAVAKSEQIQRMAEVLKTPEGMAALQYDLAKEYFDALAKLGEGQGTVIIPSNMADLTSVVAGATKAFETINKRIPEN